MPEHHLAPATMTYTLTYRLVGPAYATGRPPRQRTLTVLRNDLEREARTDEEARESLREFTGRPFVNAEVEVIRLTRVTTTVEHEDVTTTLLTRSEAHHG